MYYIIYFMNMHMYIYKIHVYIYYIYEYGCIYLIYVYNTCSCKQLNDENYSGMDIYLDMIICAKQSCKERLKVLEFEVAPNKNG